MYYADKQLIPDSLYAIDWKSSTIILSGRGGFRPDSVVAEYSVFPVDFSRVYMHKSPGYNRISPPVYRPPSVSGSREGEARLQEGSLRSNGSLSRGVALGNTRDASLTSNLNLQLEGKLNRDYRIEAILSDANIPVQPEGNTQQIQEFDKVYMRIYSPRNEIVAGDFDLRPAGGYFLQMNKRVQGARFTTETPGGDGKVKFRSSTAAAVVKGKYARNLITGTEGNQGPYMLRGANGESYIQVIAGSEKVYIDGQLLMRGDEADYTIDYNTAEIRFTPKHLITKDKRITAEFEYTERSYSRFLFFNENRWTTGKGLFYMNLFTENDARNQPLLQDLTDANKLVLGRAGDNPDLARVSTIRESTYRGDRVFYRLADTLVNGIRYDSILIQSYHPDSVLYEAAFSFVGEGRGHYEQAQSAANGRVFRWVAPQEGIPAGSYAPAARLVMPQSKQVLSAGMQHQLGSRMQLDMEWSVTRNDLNTFSALDDGDNTGIGLKAGLARKDYLNKDSSTALSSYVRYRYTGARFNPAERYRDVEFSRDWNLGASPGAFRENFLESGVALGRKDSLDASYRLEYLNAGATGYAGLRQFTGGKLRGRKWDASWAGSYLLTSDTLRRTAFLRHNASFRRSFGSVRVEVAETAEDNRWRNPGSDTLLLNSQSFSEFQIGALQQKGDRQPWSVKVRERTDRLPQGNRLTTGPRAWEAEGWADLSKNPALPFRAGIHMRSLQADSGALSNSESGRSLTGRIDNRWQAWKGLLRSQTFLEVGSGYDRKPEYSYLEVAAGQGNFTWNDYNGNGIRELNEFETAFFSDQASYIRVFRLGNEFIPTLLNRFNQVFTIQPKKGFVSKFTSTLAYRIDKKTTRGDYLFLINPFTNDPLDMRLINLNSQLRHTLAFNRSGTKFNAELVTQKTAVRTTLLTGADGRVAWLNALQLRYRFHPAWQLNSGTEWSGKQSVSEFFPARNFLLESISQLLQVECQAAKDFRIGTDWEYRSETNRTDGSGLQSGRIESVLTAQIPDRGQVSLSVQYVYVKFTGEAASPAGYAMLRGFGNGHNGVARLSARYKLGKFLVLEGVYEGRAVKGGRTVHNAQLQVRAVF
jgi:hypothetical protein